MPSRAKHAAVVTLAILNLVLLVALLVEALALPKAAAQPAAADVGDRFLVVTGEIQDGYDAVYMIDTVAKRLYTLTMSRTGQNRAVLRDIRNLEADFRTQPTPTAPRRGGR